MKSTYFFIAIFGLCLVGIMARPQNLNFDARYNERNLADEDQSPQKRLFWPWSYYRYANRGNGGKGGGDSGVIGRSVGGNVGGNGGSSSHGTRGNGNGSEPPF